MKLDRMMPAACREATYNQAVERLLEDVREKDFRYSDSALGSSKITLDGVTYEVTLTITVPE